MVWPFVLPIDVRWADLDGAGHVNNAKYFTYFEMARTQWYIGVRQGAASWRDLDIILASTACDFFAQASMGDALEVRLMPGRVGRTSFDLAYELVNATTGEVVARGTSVQVCFDYQAQRKMPIPDEVRSALTSAPSVSSS